MSLTSFSRYITLAHRLLNEWQSLQLLSQHHQLNPNASCSKVTAQAPGQAVGCWPEQHTHYTMDISGTIQFYDSRVSSSFPRATMAPLCPPFYPSTSMAASHPQMHPFNPYPGADPAFANHIQQQLLLPLTGFVEELHSAPPTIKSEAQWNGPGNSPSANTKTVATASPTNGSKEVNFGTEVDTLMKAIQAKTQTTTPQKPSSADQSRPVVGVSRTPPCVQATSQARAYGSGDPSQYKLTQKDV
jgi:hypothetical protein